ncbi:MAG: muconate cycloisomerase [Planctomycetota bacterium]|nr:MAG: muconate cycloisomerase [Planctomycetota bacterium]
MRISAIETRMVRIPLKPERRMVSALGRHDHSDFLLLRLCTDAGIEGVGEATVTPQWSGETVWGAKALIDRVLAPLLLGRDPRDIDDIDRTMARRVVGNWFARAAVEMACWDVIGRSENRPVFELLGGAVRPLTVKSRFSLGAYPPDVAAERAAERVAAGFDTIKVKVGTDPQEDIERVRAVRAAVGEATTITIDANGGWDFDTALRCVRALEPVGVAWVEQPLPRGEYTRLRRLKERTGCRVLADESCFDLVQAEELITQGCCDALTVYPGKNGGIARARAIAALAEEHGIPCTIGSNLEWDVATAAMMHLVVGTPNMQVERLPGDCLGPSYHEFSVAKDPLPIDGPFTTLPRRPGLGVEVDWDRVAAHVLPD